MSKFRQINQADQAEAVQLFQELIAAAPKTDEAVRTFLSARRRSGGGSWSKTLLHQAYLHLKQTGEAPELSPTLIKLLQLKPVRTISGVTPVTVLTKPFPCPGQCIFCPNDIRMPKSYLADEPGAQRAERNYFDPYLQTYNRLQALQNIGHSISKVELIVLGGTWSFYPEQYQIWFIKECFRALNEFGSSDDRPRILEQYQQMAASYRSNAVHSPTNDPVANAEALQPKQIHGESFDATYNQVISELYVAPERLAGFDAYQKATWEQLEFEQRRNEMAASRSVGLVVETRPDHISPVEVRRIRRLGATKTQIGIQSLNDEVLDKNRRGHNVAATRKAFRLLRQAGFKIHAHWMPNLYGSTPELDKADFLQLFADPDFCPDELKIYPCSLIESAELMQYYQRGEWQPYSYEQLLDVLTFCLRNTPGYCRLTRVIRDIPSTDIVVGNKLTNFRQLAESSLAEAGELSNDIRAREIRSQEFDPALVRFETIEYATSVSRELFLQAVVPVQQNGQSRPKLLGFARLSLPTEPSFLPELQDQAVLRELHVYGQVMDVGKKGADKPQHLGLGSKLLAMAKEQARAAGFTSLAVISAIGTREYYRQRDFLDGELYLHCNLV